MTVRGTCPVCRRKFALLNDGRIGRHSKRWPSTPCKGWGQQPLQGEARTSLTNTDPTYIYVVTDDRGDLRAAFTDPGDIKAWAQRAQDDDEDLTGWTLYRMVDNPNRGHRPQPRNLTSML